MRRFAFRSIFIVILAATAVAAFGITFHFFGSSAEVPEPSREFGFFLLSPIAVIDRIYLAVSGIRLIWQPLPMFLILWAAYALLATAVYCLIRVRRSQTA